MNRKRLAIGMASVVMAFGAWAVSPYASRVLDFCPAPGQFVNVLPEADAGTSYSELLQRVEEQIVGTDDDPIPGLVSLGAFGGYLVFGFDHPVVNVPGEYDFKVFGNAFKASGLASAGSNEPGIVMVSADSNHNGIPDDEWYELAGSEYNNPETNHHFEITYFKPSDPFADIEWVSNDPLFPSGRVARNMFHTQSYWPAWIDDPELTFKGSRLPSNAYQDGGVWYLRSFDWGYVDNLPNNDTPGFNIDWAVDAHGNSVRLGSVDFIKVYTGLCQAVDVIGETSTEVGGAMDLHPSAVDSIEEISAVLNDTPTAIFDLQGRRIAAQQSSLPEGMYIFVSPRGSRKVIIKR